MAIELKLQLGIAEMSFNLNEFLDVIKKLAGEAKEKQVKQSIKEMIAETRKSYDTVVDVVTPLYTIRTEETLKDKFAGIHAQFNNVYLKNFDEARTHCHIVIDKLNELKKKKAWLESMPVIKKAFKKLEGLSTKWIAQDEYLARIMNDFLTEIETFFHNVEAALQKDASNALAYLLSEIEKINLEFLNIKSQLDELKMISNKL